MVMKAVILQVFKRYRLVHELCPQLLAVSLYGIHLEVQLLREPRVQFVGLSRVQISLSGRGLHRRRSERGVRGDDRERRRHEVHAIAGGSETLQVEHKSRTCNVHHGEGKAKGRQCGRHYGRVEQLTIEPVRSRMRGLVPIRCRHCKPKRSLRDSRAHTGVRIESRLTAGGQ